MNFLLVFPLSDDFNRVILTKSEEDGHSDYINASYINVREITRSCAIIQMGFCLYFNFFQGFRKPRDYIASQGPKMDSSYDFWRMIVQFKVSSVVRINVE